MEWFWQFPDMWIPKFPWFLLFHYACFALQWFLRTPSITKSVQRIQGPKSINSFRFRQFWLKMSASRIHLVYRKGFVNILSIGGIIFFEMIQFICISTLSLLARCWFCVYIFHQSRLGIYIDIIFVVCVFYLHLLVESLIILVCLGYLPVESFRNDYP